MCFSAGWACLLEIISSPDLIVFYHFSAAKVKTVNTSSFRSRQKIKKKNLTYYLNFYCTFLFELIFSDTKICDIISKTEFP